MLGELVENAREFASTLSLDVPDGLQDLIDGGTELDLSDPRELGTFISELLHLCLQLPAEAISNIVERIGERFMDALNSADPTELMEKFNPSKMAASQLERESKKFMSKMTDELLNAYLPREG